MRAGKHLLKIFFLLTILLSSKNTIAQSDDPLYSTAGIEVKPTFPGGISEFYKFIGKNFQTPKVEGLQGKVYVTFIIEKDGSVTDIKILRDIGYGTGEEAVRVLKECPKWNPGIQKGKPVRVLYSLPITINTQKNNPVKQQIIENSGIDTQPTFIGGKDKLKEYLKQNYKIPPGCQIGNVFTSFVVEEDGSLSDIKILKDMGFGSGEEAIRVLKESPKWNHATHNGKPIRVTHTLAISTNITDDPKDEIYTTREVFEKPVYPGGMDNFFSDVAKTYKIPEKKGLNGRIYVEFIIEPDGSLTNARILKDIGYGTGEEALRCLAQLKNWIPGKLEDGTKVRTSYSLPITVITKN